MSLSPELCPKSSVQPHTPKRLPTLQFNEVAGGPGAAGKSCSVRRELLRDLFCSGILRRSNVPDVRRGTQRRQVDSAGEFVSQTKKSCTSKEIDGVIGEQTPPESSHHCGHRWHGGDKREPRTMKER